MLYLFEKNLCALVFSCSSPQIIKQQTMEKSTEPQPSTQWFVFFKDQLLLKKGYTDKGEIKYSVPVSIEPPLTPEAGSNIHEVFPPNGKQVRAFALEQPVAETDEWVMIGLRASYDYISSDEYRSAGKAFQILYWGRAQPLLPRVWYRHGAPDPHHEEVSQLRQ